MGNTCLGHTVDRLGWQRHKPSLRAHVDDAATFLADHDSSGSLCREECALQIDRERLIKIALPHVFGEVLRGDASIVDKNVQAAEMLDSLIDSTCDLPHVRNVHLQP